MIDVQVKPLASIPEIGRKRRNSVSALHDAASEPSNSAVALWYDTRALSRHEADRRAALIAAFAASGFNGVLLHPDNWHEFLRTFDADVLRILDVEAQSDWDSAQALCTEFVAAGGGAPCIASADGAVLALAREAGWRTCMRKHVDDAATLGESYEEGVDHDVVMVSFKDPTNIPLELVIAELHGTDVQLIKEVGTDVDDAIIALGVLELGSDGVIAAFDDPAQFEAFRMRLLSVGTPTLQIQAGTVVGTRHLGLGYRACIDTTHMFEPDEGLLVGSTSTGGVLCCPEVFHLPYMELRPFRINAAAVHSYVFHANERTNYISELKAGSQVTAVNAAGRCRQVYVGRIKTEIRPLLLIEVRFDGGELVNIVMQDDWHVRIFSAEAKPRHITELCPGDRVLGFTSRPGRHVGVQVDEHIIEC
ncbi:3-dehydroquinate synthase II [Cupriavidus agavae]|uniref:3-dehydroquinate synthase II n=1 Tax=Cupriavidus agavae TaxID=1001822 RepID=A0A4Q7S0Y0_9BURK|nr:3-dehydroquinate synthase II [Cupriavidus agavae]RZT38612.1 3-dehydroquinate synthase II [Cupriavidus agavae]